MSESDEITVILNRLVEKDNDAASELWSHYWDRLVTLARSRLRSSHRRVADEEDVALSAFNSFCNAAQAGQFPSLGDRDDLWKLLVTITTRKAVAQLRREHAKKRGDCNSCDADSSELVNALANQPTPELAAMAAEQVEILLSQLDDLFRQTALLKCEGYSVSEIAEKMNCVNATVRRRLGRIRDKWSELLAEEGTS